MRPTVPGWASLVLPAARGQPGFGREWMLRRHGHDGHLGAAAGQMKFVARIHQRRVASLVRLQSHDVELGLGQRDHGLPVEFGLVQTGGRGVNDLIIGINLIPIGIVHAAMGRAASLGPADARGAGAHCDVEIEGALVRLE